MSRRVLSPAQRKVNETMAEANYEARKIMADEGLRNAAQVRLNVKRNKLYTALIKEYFKNVREAKEISGWPCLRPGDYQYQAISRLFIKII